MESIELTVPSDPAFYADLLKGQERTGVKPEDALFAWSDATNLKTDLAGGARTFAALPKGFMVPFFASEEIWQRFPEMTAREQLPYVQTATFGPARKFVGGRELAAFETYLASFGPGLLRTDGCYCPMTVLFAGSCYPENWTLDNFPIALSAYQDWAADASRLGRDTSVQAAYPECLQLLSRGELKGFVTLGDLLSFAKRSAPLRDAALGEALANLAATRVTLGMMPENTGIDLDASFTFPDARPDSRALSPREAQDALPTALPSRTVAIEARWALGLGLGLGILGTGLWLHKKAS